MHTHHPYKHKDHVEGAADSIPAGLHSATLNCADPRQAPFTYIYRHMHKCTNKFAYKYMHILT